MKRVYASVAVILILPPLLLALLLEHYEIVTGIDWIDRYLRALHLLLAFSSAQHPEFWWWVIGILTVGFISFAAVDWVTELLSRDVVKRIAQVLDQNGPDAPETSSRWDGSQLYASTRGRFQGRDVAVTLRASYAQHLNYNWLRVAFACRSPWPFRIEHKDLGARVMDFFGQPHAPSGDAALDEHLLFVADDHAFFTWVCEPENRRTVLALTVEHGVSSIDARSDDAPILQATYTRVSLFRGAFLLRHIQGVLEGVVLLADSLEHPAERVAGAVRHGQGSEAPAERSAARLPRRRRGQALILGGVLLLTGLPGTLFYGLGGQPSYVLMCILAALPWLGIGMLLAGVSRWRHA